MHLVEASGYLRTQCVTAAFDARSSMLAALQNQTDKVLDFEHRAAGLASQLQLIHLENYEAIASKHMMEFYSLPNITLAVPAGDHWILEKLTFWELGNEAARRIERGAAASIEDLADPDYHVTNISEAKSQLVYINENLFRAILPGFEAATEIYQNDMLHLHELIVQVVAISTAVQCALIFVIAVVSVRGIWVTMFIMHHYLVACTLAFSIPHVSAKKFHSYYSRAEHSFRLTDEDDDEEVVDKLVGEENQEHEKDMLAIANGEADEPYAVPEASEADLPDTEDGKVPRLRKMGSLTKEVNSVTLSAANLAKHLERLEQQDVDPSSSVNQVLLRRQGSDEGEEDDQDDEGQVLRKANSASDIDYDDFPEEVKDVEDADDEVIDVSLRTGDKTQTPHTEPRFPTLSPDDGRQSPDVHGFADGDGEGMAAYGDASSDRHETVEELNDGAPVGGLRKAQPRKILRTASSESESVPQKRTPSVGSDGDRVRTLSFGDNQEMQYDRNFTSLESPTVKDGKFDDTQHAVKANGQSKRSVRQNDRPSDRQCECAVCCVLCVVGIHWSRV